MTTFLRPTMQLNVRSVGLGFKATIEIRTDLIKELCFHPCCALFVSYNSGISNPGTITHHQHQSPPCSILIPNPFSWSPTPRGLYSEKVKAIDRILVNLKGKLDTCKWALGANSTTSVSSLYPQLWYPVLERFTRSSVVVSIMRLLVKLAISDY